MTNGAILGDTMENKQATLKAQQQQKLQQQQRSTKRSIEQLLNSAESTANARKQYVLTYDSDTSTDSETLSDETVEDIDDDEDIDEEAETAVAQALVRATISRTLSVPSLLKLIGSERQPSDAPALKKARVQRDTSASLGREKSASVPSLLHLTPNRKTSTQTKSQANSTFVIKPEDFLKSLLMYKGVEFKTFAASELGDDFFVPVTPEAVAAYDMDVVKDIRNEDVKALRSKFEAGRLLQCSNKFGESVVHTVARRGSLQVLEFLLNEANVSCQVCCDSGRSPLADACWTTKPNFELISLLLDKCPDLLYITDRRGFTPLAYVSPEHHGVWCEFLKERSIDRLLPRKLK